MEKEQTSLLSHNFLRGEDVCQLIFALLYAETSDRFCCSYCMVHGCPIRFGLLVEKLKKKLSLAVTRIRTWVTSATTKGTNHYTITAM